MNLVTAISIIDEGQRKADEQTTPQPKAPQGAINVREELQQIRRIVNGANKKLERLCEQIDQK